MAVDRTSSRIRTAVIALIVAVMAVTVVRLVWFRHHTTTERILLQFLGAAATIVVLAMIVFGLVLIWRALLNALGWCGDAIAQDDASIAAHPVIEGGMRLSVLGVVTFVVFLFGRPLSTVVVVGVGYAARLSVGYLRGRGQGTPPRGLRPNPSPVPLTNEAEA